MALIFAQIASGIGRDPVLNADMALHPATSAAARVARTIQLAHGDNGALGVLAYVLHPAILLFEGTLSEIIGSQFRQHAPAC